MQSAPDVDDLRADSVGRSTLMARVAANDPSVTQLAWHGLGLTDAEVMTLAEVLPGNTHLRMIGLGNNPLVTSASLRALAHTDAGQVFCLVHHHEQIPKSYPARRHVGSVRV